MALWYEPDVSEARWFTDSGDSWSRLCSTGPSGFARYAWLFHPPHPDDDPTDPDPISYREGDLPEDALWRLIGILACHTDTPDDCYFGLWDGFGDIHGGSAVIMATLSDGLDDPPSAPTVPPAFPPEVIEGPRLRIPARDYILFRGPLSEAGQWGAAELLPGVPRRINSPNLIWPADRKWFVATEIDLPWTGVAGSVELVDALATDPVLDVEDIDPATSPTYWRTES